MLIRQLRLSGFKSFVEPATLRIEPGLTGVVGPNGCGKSNLLEAIRWVMGENSPKSMRSGGMDDVIFAGTANRPPRDFAEVVLTAEDAGGGDLEIVRRIERGAGSAYRVNGKDVRAKDVALTFADAATGAHSPALVSQGKIAQVIAAKPAERRMMLEEAAGIAGLHVRRRDAEGKLRQTEANLARLEDLMAGLDSQIATLRRQARQAERYTQLSDEIRVAEARLIFARWRDAAAAADQARQAALDAEGKVAAAQRAAEAVQKAQHSAAEALAAARDTQADRRADASAHGHRMATLASQLEAAEQRIADLAREQERLEADRGDADRLTRDAADALARLERDLAEQESTLAAGEAQRPALVLASEKAEAAARAAELALAKALADNAAVEAEWRVVEAEVAQARLRLDRLESDARRLRVQRDALGREDIDAAVTAARTAADEAGAALHEARASFERSRAARSGAQAAREEAASALSEARAELAGIQREHSALTRDREARLRAVTKGSGRRPAIEAVRAEKGYERALAAALGREGKALIGAPQDGEEGRYWAGVDLQTDGTPSLLDHLAACPPELRAYLSRVVVAEADDGCPLDPGQTLVTRDGILRRWDGLTVRGEGAADAARLEADNRLADLDTLLPRAQESFARRQAEYDRAERALTAVQQDAAAAERAVAKAGDNERTALRTLDQAEGRREQFALQRSSLARMAEEHESALREAIAAQEEARRKQDALPDPAAGRAALTKAQEGNDAARAAFQHSAARLAAHDQDIAVIRERTAAQRADMASWQARSGEAARRLAQTTQRFAQLDEERAIAAARPEGLVRELDQGETVRARLSAELVEAEAALSGASAAAGEAERALTAAKDLLSELREQRAALAERATSQDARRIEMTRIAGERFQTPPPLLPGKFAFAGSDVGTAESESTAMDRLVVSRERIGPVNLVAAEELTRMEGEHGSNASEQQELREAVARLRGSIGNLNREGRERLREAFTQVDAHFRRLFTRLFEGGQAQLALIDSDDPLEAGLEIFAQPPGKRLQSLTLLSGGEQALTAIALIFALFLTNPAPICVLDEVDAPLDDANIERFCDLLEHMTRETDTRYLIVTHNAVTMSRMHRLFGVTMIERGVSRLVSVDLGGAEELLAAE
ncbi:AAA family ATPase [Qipengyuania sp.]|uniref:AAA family ATPase n=1 Tax=Qipengyuania sp. TaxID=2004515 RepID=UPI003735E3E9